MTQNEYRALTDFCLVAEDGVVLPSYEAWRLVAQERWPNGVEVTEEQREALSESIAESVSGNGMLMDRQTILDNGAEIYKLIRMRMVAALN